MCEFPISSKAADFQTASYWYTISAQAFFKDIQSIKWHSNTFLLFIHSVTCFILFYDLIIYKVSPIYAILKFTKNRA